MSHYSDAGMFGSGSDCEGLLCLQLLLNARVSESLIIVRCWLKIPSWEWLLGITRLVEWCRTVIPSGGIFNSRRATIIGSSSCILFLWRLYLSLDMRYFINFTLKYVHFRTRNIRSGSYLGRPDVMHEVVLHSLVWNGNIEKGWKSRKTLSDMQEKI